MSTWKITGVKILPQAEGQVDVVSKVAWVAKLSEADKTASECGDVRLEYTAGNNFVPFEQLTEEQLVDWVKAALGDEEVAKVEANLSGRLQYLLAPTVVNKPLPWISNE
jgi:hypothetical protein